MQAKPGAAHTVAQLSPTTHYDAVCECYVSSKHSTFAAVRHALSLQVLRQSLTVLPAEEQGGSSLRRQQYVHMLNA
jgi:hypothetical protein